MALGPTSEHRFCVRCGANLRYEMLATYLRESTPALGRLSVLELDPQSPLRPLLREAERYVVTYYSADAERGTLNGRGARCEDVTCLTFGDREFDLVVSSEVLEHVPELQRAVKELRRVLRDGGRHVFTVPTLPGVSTQQRARWVNGKLEHLLPPEYHGDPQGQGGILAFWSFGVDAADYLSTDGLVSRIVAGPNPGTGEEHRVVWESTRRPAGSPGRELDDPGGNPASG